ncbi:LCI family antimicrobial peptide [Photorhabdus bodei]|uniref:LCI family antimicrobial peptide n=1 Tax=Photorhabdus bodei TaxID=2029681 RepID=A0AAW6BSY7_9GAMM|nr:LCI family antimicrobial peptide [Photorhabdus bodei]MDB6374787.1 LCI family antimicrobial peptide [Photorhabdus bodei]
MCKLKNHANYKTIKEGIFMFKKLLVVGALVSGIALTGGIGVASADVVPPSWTECYSSDVYTSYRDGWLYTQYLVQDSSSFSNVYYGTVNGKSVKWYFKGIDYLSSCEKYVGKYEGRDAD